MRLKLRQRLAIALAKRLKRRLPQPDPAELGTDKIHRILAISSTAIGDLLMSTAGMSSLRLGYPNAHIDALVPPLYTALLANNPDIDDIIGYDNRWKTFCRTVWTLRKKHYDMVVVLHGNEPQITPLTVFIEARWRFKLPNDFPHRYLLSNSEVVYQWHDFSHGIDQRLAVARLAGGLPRNHEMTLHISPETQAALDQHLVEEFDIDPFAPLVAFQIGASTRERCWRPERFAELGHRLLKQDSALKIILTGSPAEYALLNSVAKMLGEPDRVLVSAGQFPLSSLPALLRRCQILVTPDTGIMHMAIAVGTPTVSLFASADATRSGPTVSPEKHIVIQKWRTCNPCFERRCKYANSICMDNITVDEVYAACLQHLNINHRRDRDERSI
ncbi:glycosyl transferase family 9 [Jeongeupia sp. HS-3]|uniref:glycosyltransferase family 9 protein n=1 Tax=Jeongeupia sp. HS-3 TaxID=1009682 RepID=UPI0018A5BAAF|nr:glycosyltransferase family 9 protein [Jeongeupia sp. HS-3]BCL76900.1 glycosyl transferase family 9 [Jeongeupia sp. HS-3]